MTKEKYIELFEALLKDAEKNVMILEPNNVYFNEYFDGVAWAYSNVLNLVKHENVAEMVYNKLVKQGGGKTESN